MVWSSDSPSRTLARRCSKRIRTFIAASRDYIPVAGEIRRVEDEIKDIRGQAQTDALFRGQEMIDLDSESLRPEASPGDPRPRLYRLPPGSRQRYARGERHRALAACLTVKS